MKVFDEDIGKYKIRDLSLHEFGRKEIELAEVEMPGLMSCRKEFGPGKPLLGVRIIGSLHMTIQTAVLIETLKELGADIRWCSCNIYSTQDHAASALVQSNSASIFAWKGESIEEYWLCTESALTFPDGKSPDLIVDDGGDATLLVHEGVKAEKLFRENKTLPRLDLGESEDMKCVRNIIRRSIEKDPLKWTRMAKNIKGVAEETTTGVNRLYQMANAKELLFPAINVNDSVTKSKFDNVYGVEHSLPDGIKRATDVMIAGKTTVICGYGAVGKGCAKAMSASGSRVIITEIDPICALQACMEGLQVCLLESVLETADIIVTATGNKDVLTAEHLSRLKNNAIVCNIGHFDNEIDMNGLEALRGVKCVPIKAQVDRFVFEDGKGIIVLARGRLVNLGCATGHPSFVMSNSFTNQVLAVLDLWKSNYEIGVYILPKELDEKVARLHLDKLGAQLTVMTDEQAKYIGVPKKGPFKPRHYLY